MVNFSARKLGEKRQLRKGSFLRHSGTMRIVDHRQRYGLFTAAVSITMGPIPSKANCLSFFNWMPDIIGHYFHLPGHDGDMFDNARLMRLRNTLITRQECQFHQIKTETRLEREKWCDGHALIAWNIADDFRIPDDCIQCYLRQRLHQGGDRHLETCCQFPEHGRCRARSRRAQSDRAWLCLHRLPQRPYRGSSYDPYAAISGCWRDVPSDSA